MKAVVFDMDGVIIDSEPVHIRLEEEMFGELGLSLSREEHESFMGTSSYEFFESLKKRFRLNENVVDLVADERRRYLKILSSAPLPIIPGIPELLKRLGESDYRLAVASSAPHEQIDLVMDRSGFADLFDFRVSGDDVENSKPDPAIFRKAASGLRCRPDECWLLEDSTNGITAGRSAGMRTVGFADPAAAVQNLSAADYLVDNIPAVIKLILGRD